MLSLDYIRQNKQKVAAAAKNKGSKVDLEKILSLDEKRKELLLQTQSLRQERNKSTTEKPSEGVKEKGRELKNQLKKLEDELTVVEKNLNQLLLQVPNLPTGDVPVGKDETANKVLKKWGEPKKFNFQPKDHLELGEQLDIVDIKAAAKISGTRFGYLKNEAVALEFALVQLALNALTKEGFLPVIPPALIKKEVADGLGYWQGGGNEDYYFVQEPDEKIDFYLIGTSEHSIVPIHKDEVLQKKELPKRYVGFSTNFRREAGSYGKDTRGIFRVHQFDKVEMVSFTTEEGDDKEHEYLLSLEEKLWQMFEIPYQVVQMSTGDLGFPIARKYDIEAWIPSQNRYREVTSTSTTTDFQARRLNIKYQDGTEKKFAHILNGTAFAIGRTLVAILENYQQKDGSVMVPEALRSYTGFDLIKKKGA